MTKLVEGGWMSYTRNVNELLGRKMTNGEYKFAMNQYLKSKPVKTTVDEINASI